MRQLNSSELMSVAGGMYCTDREGFSKIAWSAAKDGFSVAGILTPIAAVITGKLTHRVSGDPALGVGVAFLTAVISMPVSFSVGMYHSSAWNIFN